MFYAKLRCSGHREGGGEGGWMMTRETVFWLKSATEGFYAGAGEQPSHLGRYTG